MDQLIPVVGTTALLASALVGGVFFAFSSFIMKALARVPSAEGIAAMQSINVIVINPSLTPLIRPCPIQLFAPAPVAAHHLSG